MEIHQTEEVSSWCFLLMTADNQVAVKDGVET
jgi:hypothetical protein